MTWAFLAIAFFFLFAWSFMFYSRIYRFTFVDWPFFGVTTATSFATLISSTVFSFVCLRNYGKGLAQWSTFFFLYLPVFRRGVQNTNTATL